MTASIAIIGANGQIGDALCGAFSLNPGLRPVAVVRNRVGLALLRARYPDIEIRVGAVDSTRSADEILSGCKTAINCGYASAGGFHAARAANKALIEGLFSAPGVEVVVHLSSVSVYGNMKDGSSTFMRPIPSSGYGREKLAHEKIAAAAARRASKRGIILRLGHVYGAGQWISRFVLEALSSGDFLLPNDGSGASNCVAAADLARSIGSLIDDPTRSGVYNLVNTPQSSWRWIFNLHSEALGLKPAGALGADESREAELNALGPVDDSPKALLGAFAEAMRPSGLSALSRSPAVRAHLDAALAAAPAKFEAAARAVHIASSVRAQLSSLPPKHSSVPDWMFHSAIPQGPNAWVGGGAATELSGLSAWAMRLRNPRWDFEGSR